MIGDVAKKAGEGAGGAFGGPLEDLAEAGLAFMLSPWGLLVLVGVVFAIRAIR